MRSLGVAFPLWVIFISMFSDRFAHKVHKYSRYTTLFLSIIWGNRLKFTGRVNHACFTFRNNGQRHYAPHVAWDLEKYHMNAGDQNIYHGQTKFNGHSCRGIHVYQYIRCLHAWKWAHPEKLPQSEQGHMRLTRKKRVAWVAFLTDYIQFMVLSCLVFGPTCVRIFTPFMSLYMNWNETHYLMNSGWRGRMQYCWVPQDP